MLNRVWRIILLIIALVFTIWPELFIGFRWVALVAVVLLLLSELAHKRHHGDMMMAMSHSGSSRSHRRSPRRSSRSRSRKRRR